MRLMGSERLCVEFYRRDLAGKVCRRVQRSDDLRSLVAEMTRIMKASGTAGLAAPQVGVFLQVALIQKLNPHDGVDVLVNAEIANLAGKDLLDTESCLSLPPTGEATARIWRSEVVHVRAGTLENPDADQVTVYKGAMARVVQHEIDHLDGIFFIDRCQSVAREIVLRRFALYLRSNSGQRPVHSGQWESESLHLCDAL